MRPRVYISGPITLGDTVENTAIAARMFHVLFAAGMAPLCPHTHSLPLAFIKHLTHEEWMEADLPWVDVAHAVLRLPGESKGADLECAHAVSRGIPVFDDTEAVIAHFAGRRFSAK